MIQTNALKSVVRIFMKGICVEATITIGSTIGTNMGMMQLLPMGNFRIFFTAA
jgi:hypothetical protein